jgi:hypothetical protein
MSILYFSWFIFGLLNLTIDCEDYILENDKSLVNNELEMMWKWSGANSRQYPSITRRYWGKPRRTSQVSGFRAKVETRDLQNTKQKCLPLTRCWTVYRIAQLCEWTLQCILNTVLNAELSTAVQGSYLQGNYVRVCYKWLQCSSALQWISSRINHQAFVFK